MNHVKMLGLLAVAATSMMAFASSASATPTLTSPAGTDYTGEIHLTLESGNSVLFKLGGPAITCTESTIKNKVTTNNTTHALGANSVISFSKCTSHTSTTNPGELTFKPNGEVFLINSVVQFLETSPFGNISCIYGGGASPGTKIGTLTTGTPAKLVVNTTSLPRQAGSSGFCAEKGTWTANYIVTTPGSLFLV